MFEGPGYPIEVINGGVGDTTIVDQLYFLKKSRDAEVDLVILTFMENDIGDLRKGEPAYMAHPAARGTEHLRAPTRHETLLDHGG